MTFEFSVQKTFNESIDIVDIGNTALRCTNSLLDTYYMVIKTVFGKTSIIKFGPVCTEIDALLDDFTVNYKKIDYKEVLICKEINKFINDFKKGIDKIEEITDYEVWQDFPDIQQQFNNI